MGMHSGTHMDGRVHFIHGAGGLDEMPLTAIDYLSIGAYHADGAAIQKTLLQAGIWIIEGLDLSAVTGGRYEMICLPVKLHGSDGAPARAILRPIGSGQPWSAEAAP